MGDAPADEAERALKKLHATLGEPLPLADLLAALSETVRRHSAELIGADETPPSRIVAELVDATKIAPSATVDECAVAVLAEELPKVSAEYLERWNRTPHLEELLYVLAFVMRSGRHHREGEALELDDLVAG